MMGRQSRQMAMIFVDIESLIPETHLLRKIERMVSFNFIYDLLFFLSRRNFPREMPVRRSSSAKLTCSRENDIIRQQAVHLSTLSVCSKCS